MRRVLTDDFAVRRPNPGTVAERQMMVVAQPGFLEASRAGVVAARNAATVDEQGNVHHTANQHWGRFCLALRIAMRRPLDPLTTPLARKLAEVDLVDAFAWWLVAHVRCNTETAWGYVCVVNSTHDRACGVGLAGNFPLARVKSMLSGYQRLQRSPVMRRLRYGVRPAFLSRGIAAAMAPRSDALDANAATAMEVALVAIARMGELVASSGSFNLAIQPSRANVDFRLDSRGVPTECTIYIVNIKARGGNRYQRLPVRLPMAGRYLSPGWALWYLIRVIDPVPSALAASTPLFRNPSTGAVLTVAYIRERLRDCMRAIGRDPSLYGAHSLRIGGATAMAWLRAPGPAIQAAGRWRSDAYLCYIRECREQSLHFVQEIANADTDDFQSDYLEIDTHGFDAADDD